MPREGHGSRNCPDSRKLHLPQVMPREGHGSRNLWGVFEMAASMVMPREGHGSRNVHEPELQKKEKGHAPRGAWE